MVRTKRAALLHGQTTLTFAIVGALLPVCTPHSVPICSNPVCARCRLPPRQTTRAGFVRLEPQGTGRLYARCTVVLRALVFVLACAGAGVGLIHTEPNKPCLRVRVDRMPCL